jgi:hypothetical protein
VPGVKKQFALIGILFAAAVAFADAAAWKPIENRQHLFGYRLKEGDRFMQTVVVCKFDPEVEIKPEERSGSSETLLNVKALTVGDAPGRIECVNVPVKPVPKKVLAALKKSALGYSAIPGFPWYSEFGLVSEPENKDGKFPFYYVVGADGEVLYSGCSASSAAAAAKRDAAKNAAEDKLLGAFKPTIHTDLTSQLKFGAPIAPVVKKLKALAAAKEASDGKTEAENILKMLDQSRNYWYKVVARTQDPGMKAVIAGQAVKTFPEYKKAFEAELQKLLANPIIAKVVKMFQTLYGYKQQPPEKKSDILKAYKLALMGEKAIQKARKEFGDKMPEAFVTLESLVLEIKTEMEARGVK